MPSADQVPVKSSHSTMQWHLWVVLIAGSTGSALLAVRPPNLHITPDDSQRDLYYAASATDSLYRSPLAIMAQAILAILLASATAATFVGRRANNAVSHGRCLAPSAETECLGGLGWSDLLCLVFRFLYLLLEKLFLRSLQRDQLDRQLIDLAGGRGWRLEVIVVHARAGIHTDIEGLVDRLDEGNGVRDRSTGNFLAIHQQDAGATLAKTGTVVFEVKHDGVFAGREGRWAFPPESLHVKKVIDKDWLAFEQIKAMPTATAAERIDHALGTTRRSVHLGADGIGITRDVGRVAV